MTAGALFADPLPGASLLLAFSPPQSCTPSRRTVLLIGQGRLTAARAFACLEAACRVVVAVQPDHEVDTVKSTVDQELQARVQAGQIQSVSLPNEDNAASSSFWCNWLENDIDHAVLNDIALVCVTDTLSMGNSTPRSTASAAAIRSAFYAHRIPVNIADHPELSDFRFPATYRFPLSATDSTASPLQMAITTNASSCRLSSRIRREIVHKLSRGIGSAVENVGRLRERARAVDEVYSLPSTSQLTLDTDLSYITSRASQRESLFEDGEQEEGWSSTALNKPVSQILSPVPTPSRSRCTSPNRMKRLLSAPNPLQIKPTHIPLLTPPATPPPESIANRMDDILSGQIHELPQEHFSYHDQTRMRMRFIAQISEYWPIDRLAAMTNDEADRVISLYAKASHNVKHTAASSHAPIVPDTTNSTTAVSDTPLSHDISQELNAPSRHDLQVSVDSIFASPPKARGQIFLLGSGPGSPALLTLAAHELLTKKATLILSDKLVPSEILALIPSTIPMTIAKKFPGNAEGAQNELMDLALEGALRGEIVVRLKQGDPYVYGRGGEEVLFFRKRGFEAVVVPGISSAFAAPLMAGIPVTQRGVSESVVVCTGVGRKGKGVKLPGYERSRTTVVLMGVARLQGVVHALTSAQGQEEHGRDGGARDGAPYPPYCPIAIIEKASSPDQRMVASTLEGIVEAMERAGEQRPPGMMIIGWSALALEGEGDVQVLDGVDELSASELEVVDRKRIDKWLGPKGWIMREGLDPNWSSLIGGAATATISAITES